MATQSASPSGTADEKPQNPDMDQQDTKPEVAKPNSVPSVFINSEPIREEQVQNAVKFLSHPKVRGSPVIYRRSFLEKKGLTKEEIDEAFRRVPDQHPSAQETTVNTVDGQVKSSPNVQPQVATQALQPAAAASTLRPSQFRWSHAILAVGFLAVSGAGTAMLLKSCIIPRFKSWIRKVVLEDDNKQIEGANSKPSLAEEAAAAAKAAAAAAADVARASQEMLNSKNQDKRYFEELMNLLDLQVKEMKSMSISLCKLEGQTIAVGRFLGTDHEDHQVLASNSKQPTVNGRLEFDVHSVRSSSPPASTEPAVAPHPKSYMEIMAMVQRGEKPPNVRDINDLPPDPNQQPSNPRLAPRAKPWEIRQAPYGSSQVFHSQVSGDDLTARGQENGLAYQLNGDSPGPWWQQRSAKITEIMSEDEPKSGSHGANNGQPVRRTWIPPQPPAVAMPEAAEAIRRPKPPIQNEQLSGGQVMSHSSEAADELQSITKISESGGAVEINEIQEE